MLLADQSLEADECHFSEGLDGALPGCAIDEAGAIAVFAFDGPPGGRGETVIDDNPPGLTPLGRPTPPKPPPLRDARLRPPSHERPSSSLLTFAIYDPHTTNAR